MAHDDQRRRWVFGTGYDPRHASPEDFTDDRVAELVRAAAGLPEVAVALRPQIPGTDLKVLEFPIAAHIADSFRADRVFLVGDAAHAWPPTGASAPTPASRTPQPGLQARRGGQGHRQGRAAGHLRSGATPDRAAHDEPGTGPLRHPHGARAGPGGALDYGAVAVGYRYRSSAVPGAGGDPRPLPPAQLTGQPGSRAPTCRSPSTAAGSPP